MRPEVPRLTVTEPGCCEAKWLAKKPSFNAEDAGAECGLCKASGHFATVLSKTANISFFFLVFDWWKGRKWLICVVGFGEGKESERERGECNVSDCYVVVCKYFFIDEIVLTVKIVPNQFSEMIISPEKN